jgi:hypothetical protein
MVQKESKSGNTFAYSQKKLQDDQDNQDRQDGPSPLYLVGYVINIYHRDHREHRGVVFSQKPFLCALCDLCGRY